MVTTSPPDHEPTGPTRPTDPAGPTDPTARVVEPRLLDDSGLVATGTGRPPLAWRLEAERPSCQQRSYQVQAAPDADFRAGGDLVDTGAVPSDRQWGVPLPGPALRSREVRWWRVRVGTDQGWTAWSEPVRVEAALLERADWVARPVTLGADRGRERPGPAPMFRREFAVPGRVRTARLYVSALGLHETRLNGRPVSGDLLEPGWTSYGQRLLYATHDVTALLVPGANVLSATVGDGWYRGTLTWRAQRNVYGDASALLAQLEVVLTDGERLVVATDDTWRAATGQVRADGLYEGSVVDLRRSWEGWRRPGFDDRDWSPVTPLDLPEGLEQRAMPGVREVESRPVVPTPAPGGEGLRVDAGQNLTGYLRLTAQGPEGAAVTVRHAEVLDGSGGLHTAPLRGAVSTDRYVLGGGGAPVRCVPPFTFHGFRYADIVADPGVTVRDVEVVVVASDLVRTGRFACSDEAVNRLYENTVWSQRGNFLSVPTDCPQRDERLGWTGDIQVFAATACHTFDSRSFLRSWLRDLAADQRGDGCVPNVVPNFPYLFGDREWVNGSAGWGDAAVIVPWTLYEAYGDLDVLADQYGSMRGWVEWGAGRLDADGLWSGDFHFGDWLDPGAPPDRPHESTTPTPYVATACLAHSAGLLARVARLLGHADDAARYEALRDRVARAVWRRYRERATATQTGCAMALRFGIAPPTERGRLGDALAALVRDSGGRIATGFLGTPLVLPALTATGHHAEAYQLLLNDRCPGWLHQVRQGATTVWERWDAVREDGTIPSGDMDGGAPMLSFNHYAYGAVAAWLYRTVAGLAPDPREPGYRRIVFAPVPGGGLTWARAEMSTARGEAAIRWERAGASLTVELGIPVGASGVFVLPPGEWSVLVDGRPVAPEPGCSPVPGRDALELAAGRHRLTLAPR